MVKLWLAAILVSAVFAIAFSLIAALNARSLKEWARIYLTVIVSLAVILIMAHNQVGSASR